MRYRYLLTIFILICTANTKIYTQSRWGKLNDILDKTNTVLTKTVLLTKLATLTTVEFNNSVKVVKGMTGGQPGNKNVKELKIRNGGLPGLSWEPLTYFDGKLFPSSIIGMSNYKDELKSNEIQALSSPIGFRFKSSTPNILIKWEVECSDKMVFDKVSGDYAYEQADQEIALMPPIPWNYDALSQRLSSAPVSFSFRLYDRDGKKLEKTEVLYMQSINDCIFRYKQTNLDFLFTAYIQEEHPEIEKILKAATDTKFITAIKGYQGNDADYTDMLVAAIWKVLHDRGFNYSSVAISAVGNTNKVVNQSVRSFSSSINTNQANCIDGTIVFASILRKAGIHTVLVITNDHCFLGYYRKENAQGKGEDIAYLETTMLSFSKVIDAAKVKAAAFKPSEQSKADQVLAEGYLQQFAMALKEGTKKYEFYNSRIENNHIEAEIDVDQWRNIVVPIPFH